MKEMKDIVGWLCEIERMAGDVYRKAAAVYADDLKLKKFLDRSAEDEAWHYHIMGSAAEYLTSESVSPPVIAVDRDTSDRIINYFSDIRAGLERNSISKNELIEKIISVELSEWNDIFLYVLNVLKDKSSQFKYPAAKMQAHINRIKYYLDSIENRSETLEQLTSLPPVWVENILIVDDQKMIAELIQSLLSRLGNIDIAHNGQDALNLILDKYYKLIISDIDMPIMDGISLYIAAAEKIPGIKRRFMFITGDLSPDRQQFLEKNNTRFLLKPMNISALKDTASAILFSD